MIWALFGLFLALTLGVSILLQRLLRPIGDAAVAAIRERESRYTGLLMANQTGTARYTIYDGRSYHPVKEKGRALGPFTGQKVTVTGVVDLKTGVLEVSQVNAFEE